MNESDAARLLDVIASSHAPSARDIEQFLGAAVAGALRPEQIGAFLMGIACRGLTRDARGALTRAFFAGDPEAGRGGEAGGCFFDKHSTGGVGDKLTFIVLPLAAACGVPMRKLSGGSLRHCRGTIDKLSALPGFRHVDRIDELTREVEEFGFCIGKTAPDFCAGDNLTYQLRNLCGAASSPDLIAASIMSKKLALAPKGLVLDVKVGRGSLFLSAEQARATSRCMLDIATDHDLPMHLLLTNMDAPLGRAIGGAAEVIEAIDVLAGRESDEDIRELSLALTAPLVEMSDGCSQQSALAKVLRALTSGDALQLFTAWLTHRGADLAALPQEGHTQCVFHASQEGWIADMDPQLLGALSGDLARRSGYPGAGDIRLFHTIGDRIERGTAIVGINIAADHNDAGRDRLMAAIHVSETAPDHRRSRIIDVLQTGSSRTKEGRNA
ncbi:hypothetical protein [Mesorhizobium sp.]|uniref:hypothetical protein n=1 Tax=Mesorhizobium sp. TaxID=1871066 RepID=UPI00257CD211|nr:hypothetical protein [Mesorhizobium sp.]